MGTFVFLISAVENGNGAVSCDDLGKRAGMDAFREGDSSFVDDWLVGVSAFLVLKSSKVMISIFLGDTMSYLFGGISQAFAGAVRIRSTPQTRGCLGHISSISFLHASCLRPGC